MIFRIGAEGGLTTMYNFDGTHGSTPVGGLTLGPDGSLYGMAEHGSGHGYGDIFRMTPSGAFSVVYEFKGGPDGGYPVSPLIVGADGSFYGTSYPGVAFRLTPHGGSFSVLTKIPTTSHGALVQAEDGTFYGVTEFNGKYGAGTIYRIHGSSCTVLHSFDGTGGSYPVGGLAEGADGNFYGTTTAGGRKNAGVIYRVTPAGAFSVGDALRDWSRWRRVPVLRRARRRCGRRIVRRYDLGRYPWRRRHLRGHDEWYLFSSLQLRRSSGHRSVRDSPSKAPTAPCTG